MDKKNSKEFLSFEDHAYHSFINKKVNIGTLPENIKYFFDLIKCQKEDWKLSMKTPRINTILFIN